MSQEIFTKQYWEFQIWGVTILEAHRLDTFLKAFTDGTPHGTPPTTGQLGWDSSRITEHLVKEGLLKTHGHTYIITSKGMLHLNKGGYVWQIKYNRLSKYSFAMSIVALVFSLLSIIAGISKWLN